MRLIRVNTLSVLFLLLVSGHLMFAQDTMSIAGKWRFTLDGNYKDWPVKIGEQEKWYSGVLPSNSDISLLNALYFKNNDFLVKDSINLPGTTDENGIGVPLTVKKEFSEGLERRISYDGAFWVQRKVTIPAGWTEKFVTLEFERLLGSSKVYWDGKFVGGDYGYATAHKIVIDSSITPGEHLLTILVDKHDPAYAHRGHHVVNGNGTSWNGIVGNLHLIARNKHLRLTDLQVYPYFVTKSVVIKGELFTDSKPSNLKLNVVVRRKQGHIFVSDNTYDITDTKFEGEIWYGYPIALWEEDFLHLLEADIALIKDNKVVESKVIDFGLRDLSTKDGQITINGLKMFIRGTVDCGSSPLTGYPDMTVAAWHQKLSVIKSHGFNLVRFHTWFPPEAAFQAADQLGIYLQPELMGTPYIDLEKVLKTYGSHPSFCFLSLDNEAFSHNDETRKILKHAKELDTRHLYTCTTHPAGVNCEDDFYVSAWGNQATKEWPNYEKIVGITWGGGDNVTATRFNTMEPNTTFDYSKAIVPPNKPIIAHEMGQWVMHASYDEIPKYTGVLRNTNYERMKELFVKHHDISYAEKFAKASGAFSAALYKEEIESALRTPNFAGFEELGLQDYQGQGTAVVGMVNDFMESKEIIDAETHRQFCNTMVILSLFDKRVYLSTDSLSFLLKMVNYSTTSHAGSSIYWTVSSGNDTLFRGNTERADVYLGHHTDFKRVSLPLNGIQKPTKLTLTATFSNEPISNSWDIWVYPPQEKSIKTNIRVVHKSDMANLDKYLSAGEKVLLVLTKEEIKNGRESCFAPIFWNSYLKWPQKAHTLGIYCEPEHPLFSLFPTENHSDWQWWDIAMNGSAMPINSFPVEFEPLINVIDSDHIGDKLSYLFEVKAGKGKLVVSSVDFGSKTAGKATKQLYKSLISYMESSNFNPKFDASIELIKELMK